MTLLENQQENTAAAESTVIPVNESGLQPRFGRGIGSAL